MNWIISSWMYLKWILRGRRFPDFKGYPPLTIVKLKKAVAVHWEQYERTQNGTWTPAITHGEYLLYLGEIQNMQGHAAFINKDGKVLWGYHPDEFEPVSDEEL